MSGAASKVLIRVERSERDVSADAADALITALDERPGIWLGSDIDVDGLYTRHAVALVDPCVAFTIRGREFTATAMDATGAELLGAVEPRAGEAAVPALRRFLASFETASPELALYGAFSWDYFRIADGTLPDDGRMRMLLYFPTRVLVIEGRRLREVQFHFSVSPTVAPAADGDGFRMRHDHEAISDVPGAHRDRVRTAIEVLRSGDLYSVVMSRAFRHPARTTPGTAFRMLRERNPYPAMFLANLGGGEHIFGASPDLQVRADDDCVESAPVCGTFRRGADPIEDADQAQALLDSEKEAASLAACADSDADDKSRVCEPGSVELVSHRRLHQYPTVVHTIAHLRGRRRKGVDAFDILFAHAAPATVTGSPKRAAIATIERLESGWRNWYGGAVARLASDGSCEVLTILRAARVIDGIAEVRTGGNLLADSDPELEEQETVLKAQTLLHVLDGQWPTVLVTGSTGAAVALKCSGDPFAARLEDFLEWCRCRIDASGVELVTDRSDLRSRDGIWVGDAALALLEAEGGRSNAFDTPRYARTALCVGRDGTVLAGLGTLKLGLYAARGIREDGLPVGWRAAACTVDGWVIVAESKAPRRLGILARPDSVLSRAMDSGRRIVLSAVDWIASS